MKHAPFMDTWSLFRAECGGNKYLCMVLHAWLYVSKPLHIMVHVVDGSSDYQALVRSVLFDMFKAFVYTLIILKFEF